MAGDLFPLAAPGRGRCRPAGVQMQYPACGVLVLPCRNGTSRPLIQHAAFVEFCGALTAAWEVQMAQLLVP